MSGIHVTNEYEEGAAAAGSSGYTGRYAPVYYY
ncbi:MAG: hypothetical protein ACJAXB_002437 [Candidatus Endobugula sp.]|jgi:hypothetical protein